MKFEYIIDGYNFLQARTGARIKSGPGNLRKARGALLAWLAKNCPEPAAVTVVFDAASDAARRLTHPAQTIEMGIRVLFASGHPTADELIAELCARHHHPKQLGVVSNDRAVQRSARKRGAHPLGCEAFEKQLLQRPKHSSAEPREKSLGPKGAERDHWLEVFSSISVEPLDDPTILPPPPSTASHPTPSQEDTKPEDIPTSGTPSKRKRPKPQVPEARKPTPSLESLADFYREMLSADGSESQDGG